MSTRSGAAGVPAGGAAPAVSSGWRGRAACRGSADPDVFFPVAVAGPVLAAQEAAAKAVCAGCVVQVECLAFRWSRSRTGWPMG